MSRPIRYMSRPLSAMDKWSHDIDEIIEKEKAIKSQLPEHPRYTEIRKELDREISALRKVKKEALTYWREIKRNPKITP